MNKIKTILGASILLLGSLQATTVLASLIRIDFTSVAVEKVERIGAVFESSTIPLIPYGTYVSGYFVYDTNSPPENCGVVDGGGSYCDYNFNPVVDAFVTAGPLISYGQPYTSAATVADATEGEVKALDEYSWDYRSPENNTVDGYSILLAAMILQDTSSTAVTSTDLPTDIDIDDFDIQWGKMLFRKQGVSAGFTWTEIDYFNMSTVPAPPVIWLIGIGMIGLIGFTTRSKSTSIN